MTPQHVQQAVQEMGEQYKGNAYHLLQRNCNHFSNDLCRKLTGKEAPLWVSHSFGSEFLGVDLHLSYSAPLEDTYGHLTLIVVNADQQVSWHGSHAALPHTDSMGASPFPTNSFASAR